MTSYRKLDVLQIVKKQRRSIYSASSFIEPVATSLQRHINPLTSSPRANQGIMERLLLFPPIYLRQFENVGGLERLGGKLGIALGKHGHEGLTDT